MSATKVDFREQRDSKIISLHERSSGLSDALDMVRDLEAKGLLTDFVMIYAFKDEISDDIAGRIGNYWFGHSSTLRCLGLIHHMLGIIDRYLRGVEE